MKRILCWIIGHRWRVGFWETDCTRCDAVLRDRLYHDVPGGEETTRRIRAEVERR